ncbi:Riboflavin-binding protein RibY [Dissostichus eleginoides]|uniref:Riboflavin-binding protein RibY n=1 Tax=Dissostichus eleginoides TaxID=100907 RepID=A0AAD9C1Y6_DISEL|nr:Riboflavin-binding protein RibY [Dissostichus eleginoides]
MAANKTAIQEAEIRANPATVDPTVRQKKYGVADPGANDSNTMMPVTVKPDARPTEARQQRDLCSDVSASETESECCGCLERLKEDSEDEYYTEQRITEWVLKVNSSLFSIGNDELKNSKPVEEQDVTTIKIIYTGD